MENNITKLDSRDVLSTIKHFPNQCKNSWEEINYKPLNNKEIKNILVMGMGGSALGAHIINGLRILKVPLVVSSEYNIPPWVDEHTLCFASSYSGSTEETLHATKEALGKGANIVGVTGGGELEEILRDTGSQVCLIDKKDNFCDQPRYAVGAIMMIMLRVCMEHNLLILKENEIIDSLNNLGSWQKNFEDKSLLSEVFNDYAVLENKMPLLIYAEHLSGLGNFTRNQINETGKALAQCHNIPELNHHLMEGLEFPKDNVENLYVLFFESDLYEDKIKKRFAVTKDVLEKQKIKNMSVHEEGDTNLTQALIGMLKGMYLAFSLAIIHQKDPSVVPWVDYFKEQLAK